MAIFIQKIVLLSKRKLLQKYEKDDVVLCIDKNLGSSVGSTIMGYMYALNVGLFGSNLHNVLGLVSIISVCLIVMWMTLFKSNLFNLRNITE